VPEVRPPEAVEAVGPRGRARSTGPSSSRAAARGIELRGANAEEAPGAYKDLREVLGYHAGTSAILHELTPIGVAMAPGDVVDPYKD
jgi:hypothetical protein